MSETPEYIIIEDAGMMSMQGHLYRRVKFSYKNRTRNEADVYVYRRHVSGGMDAIRSLAVKLNDPGPKVFDAPLSNRDMEKLARLNEEQTK